MISIDQTTINQEAKKSQPIDIKIDLKQIDLQESYSELEDLTPMSNFEKAFEHAKQTVNQGDNKRGSPKNIYLNLQITN